MKKVFLLLLLFFWFKGFTQENYTLSGVLTDSKNGETIFGASVYIDNSTLGVTTNDYGYFALSVPKGEHTIVFSFVGYKTVRKAVTVDKNLKLNLELIEDANKLDEVVIEAGDFRKTDIKKAQMSVAKLQGATIKKIPAVLGEVDLIKAIQLLPGVTNSGEGSSGFNVRGGAEDQNLVLLDEAVIYSSSHVFGFFSVFNNDVVKNIKLYKGGIPANFGGRASSVLDIRQKDGNKKDFKTTGGIGLVSSRLTFEGPTFKDKGSFLVAGRTTYLNVFLKMFGNENRGGFYDFNFKTDYKFSDHNKLYLSSYLGEDSVEFAEVLLNTYGNRSVNLRWNHLFSDKMFSNLSLIYSKYKYNIKLDFIGFNWKSDIKNLNFKYDLGYYKSDNLTLNFGVNTIFYNFNPGILEPSGEDSVVRYTELDRKYAFETATYLGLDHKVTSNLTMQYGLRFSSFTRLGNQVLNTYKDDKPVIYNSDIGVYESAKPNGVISYGKKKFIKNFGYLEPRYALSYRLNKDSSVKLSYNRMVQYLHLISNTSSATPLDIWAPSGKYLKPQLADQYAIGYFKNFSNNRYSLELESYYKTIANRLDYIDGANLIGQNDIETQVFNGESKAYGLEFLLRKNKGNFTGWLAYTLSKSKQRALGGRIGGLGLNDGKWYKTAHDKTHDLSLTASYKLTDKWSVSSNFIYQTGRTITYPNGQFKYYNISIPTYQNRNANRLPDYHRLDLSATLTPRKNKNHKWNSEWIFGVYNMYNRKNAIAINFRQNFDTKQNEAERTHILGIVPAITYNFKF